MYANLNVCESKFVSVFYAELPESMCLNFDCGAQIKLGFAAEFSNVLVIYTHIVKKPTDMSFCQAHVTDFSQVCSHESESRTYICICLSLSSEGKVTP